MPVTVISRQTSTPTATNILLPDAVFPSGYTPGDYLRMAVKVEPLNGVLTVLPVGALWSDEPQAFHGFLVGDFNKPIITTGRGSVVTPRILNNVPFVPNRDVYLSVVPGYVTQETSTQSETSAVKVGYALDAARIILSGDYRTEFY
jgi:hypothetical protein